MKKGKQNFKTIYTELFQNKIFRAYSQTEVWAISRDDQILLIRFRNQSKAGFGFCLDPKP